MKKLLLAVVVLAVFAAGALAIVNVALDRTAVKTYAIAEPIREIVVKSESGDVRIVAGSGRVAVRETQHYVTKKPTLDRDVVGGVLTLDSHCDGAFVMNCSSDLRVTVPEGIEVTVDVDSGDVHADDVDVREAHLRSDSGDVRAELSGRQSLVWAHTDSGRVDVSAANAAAIDVQTDSGDVKVDAAVAPRRIVANSDSGDVKVSVPAGEYAVEADTDSGDVDLDDEISRNDRAPRSIDARTDSGDVDIEAG